MNDNHLNLDIHGGCLVIVAAAIATVGGHHLGSHQLGQQKVQEDQPSPDISVSKFKTITNPVFYHHPSGTVSMKNTLYR